MMFSDVLRLPLSLPGSLSETHWDTDHVFLVWTVLKTCGAACYIFNWSNVTTFHNKSSHWCHFSLHGLQTVLYAPPRCSDTTQCKRCAMQHNTDGSFLFQYLAELSPSWLPLQLGSESSQSWTPISTNQPRVTTRQSKSVVSRFILWFKAFCSVSSLESFRRKFLHTHTHTFLNISTKCSCRCVDVAPVITHPRSRNIAATERVKKGERGCAQSFPGPEATHQLSPETAEAVLLSPTH